MYDGLMCELRVQTTKNFYIVHGNFHLTEMTYDINLAYKK